MQLNNIQIETRVRSPWEAIDLGFLLTRIWWPALFLSWLLPASVVYITVATVFHQYPWLSSLVLWWLKPLWDRGALVIASQRLFGNKQSYEKLFNEVLLSYRHRWWQTLTYARFNPTRAFDLPVYVLEQVKGKALTKRQNVLHRKAGNSAFWLTIACMHIELFLLIGLYLLVVAFVPEAWQVDFIESSFENSTATSFFMGGLTLLSLALVGPFYVLAGFLLYVSRRVELEAWDVELRFKALAKRVVENATHVGSLVLVVCLLIVAPPPTYADGEELSESLEHVINLGEDAYRAEEAKSAVEAILAEDDFHNTKLIERWQYIENEEQDEEADFSGLTAFFEALKKIFSVFKPLAEALGVGLSALPAIVITLLILATLYVLFLARGLIPGYSGKYMKTRTKAPEVLFGMDVREKSLPDDIPTAVIGLLRQHKVREAVALLYRSSLIYGLHRFEIPFSASDTEKQCLQRAQGVDNERFYIAFKNITLAWLQLAYAHRQLNATAVEQLLQQWQEVFSDDEH